MGNNAIIEINSQEVPILDGSAKNFVDSIYNAGLKFSDQPIKVIKKPLCFSNQSGSGQPFFTHSNGQDI